MEDIWNKFCEQLKKYKKRIDCQKTFQINPQSLLQLGKDLVQYYFREARPFIFSEVKNEDYLQKIDVNMQDLLRLTHGRSKKDLYCATLKSALNEANNLLIKREMEISKSLIKTERKQFPSLSNIENDIIKTLDKLTPPAALSYRQAIVDLKDLTRKSFRGTASELREALRETLDQLAPDNEVTKQKGFFLEKNQTKPTMKQKARFILESRKMPKNALKTPEDAINIIEEKIASLARSTYERFSISSHINSTRDEVVQIKKYLDVVLTELLLIPPR